MSLDRVRAAVMDKAKAESEKILAEARAEVEKLDAAAKAGDESHRAEALREARQRTERELSRELGQIRQEGRMALLSAKNDQMNKVFAEAREKLLAMPETERVNMVAGWLKALADDAGGALRVNPKEVAAFQAQLDSLNQGRSGAGRFTAVEADASVAGGAWVVGPDFAADCTLDRRLEQLRESSVAELAAKLFG